jgi:hypothetical protein
MTHWSCVLCDHDSYYNSTRGMMLYYKTRQTLYRSTYNLILLIPRQKFNPSSLTYVHSQHIQYVLLLLSTAHCLPDAKVKRYDKG